MVLRSPSSMLLRAHSECCYSLRARYTMPGTSIGRVATVQYACYAIPRTSIAFPATALRACYVMSAATNAVSDTDIARVFVPTDLAYGAMRRALMVLSSLLAYGYATPCPVLTYAAPPSILHACYPTSGTCVPTLSTYATDIAYGAISLRTRRGPGSTPYAPTPCPVLRYRMLLVCSYARSSTEIAHAARISYATSGTDCSYSTIAIRTCYSKSGTDIAFG
eukprot:998646-Rhodomonas_salina.1